MDEFVIDTSIVMTWCFEDESNPYTDKILDSLETHSAVVPAIWPLEICNVLLAAERKKRIGEADSIRFMTLIANLPIIVEQESSERNASSYHWFRTNGYEHGKTPP